MTRRFLVVLAVLATVVFAVPAAAEEPRPLRFGVDLDEDGAAFEGGGWLYVYEEGVGDTVLVGDAEFARVVNPHDGRRVRAVVALWFRGGFSKLHMRGRLVATTTDGDPSSGGYGLVCSEYNVKWELNDNDLSRELMRRGFEPTRRRGRGMLTQCITFFDGEPASYNTYFSAELGYKQ